MFCPKCGKQLSDTAKFCTGCGNALTPSDAKPQESPAPQTEQPEQAAAAPNDLTDAIKTGASAAEKTENAVATAAEQVSAAQSDLAAAINAEQAPTTQIQQTDAVNTEPEAAKKAKPANENKAGKKKSKKGLVIGLVCGIGALVAAGALAFVFAKSAVLHTVLGDEGYAKSVMSDCLDGAVSKGKDYIDLAAANAGQIKAAADAQSSSRGTYAAAADENGIDKNTAETVYRSLDEFNSAFGNATITAGITFDAGDDLGDLIPSYMTSNSDGSDNGLLKLLEEISKVSDKFTFGLSENKQENSYDLSVFVNKDSEKLIVGTVSLNKDGTLKAGLPGISNTGLTAALPSYDDVISEDDETDEKAGSEVDHEKLTKLYEKIKEAYFKAYKDADIQYSDTELEIGESVEKCTLVSVKIDKDELAEMLYAISDAIGDDNYLPELCENLGVDDRLISDIADSLTSTADNISESSSKTSLTTECYVTSSNKVIGLTVSLSSKDSSGTNTASIHYAENSKNAHLAYNVNKSTPLELDITKENETTGSIKINIDPSGDRSSSSKNRRISLRANYSDVKKINAFGKDLLAGKITLSLDNSPYLKDMLEYQDVGSVNLYDVLNSLSLTASLDSEGEGIRAEIELSGGKYGKVGLKVGIAPTANTEALPESVKFVEATKPDELKTATADIRYDAFKHLHDSIKNDTSLTALDSSVSGILGASITETLETEMKRIENSRNLLLNYSDYNENSISMANQEAYDLYNYTSLSYINSKTPVTLKLWFDKDGNLEIIDACGVSESDIRDMYRYIELRKTYAEIIVWKARNSYYPIGVTVVKSDKKDVSARTPDEYNYIDQYFDWDEPNLKDGYVLGTSNYLYTEAVSNEREADQEKKDRVKTYNELAKKVYDTASGYINNSGITSENNNMGSIKISSDSLITRNVSFPDNSSAIEQLSKLIDTLSLRQDGINTAVIYIKNSRIIGAVVTDSTYDDYEYYGSDYSAFGFTAPEFISGIKGNSSWSYIDGLIGSYTYGTYPVITSTAVTDSDVSFEGDTGDKLVVYLLDGSDDLISTYAKDLISQAGVDLDVEYGYYDSYSNSFPYSVESDADIIIASPYWLEEYRDSAATASELGITDSDLASQYDYTKNIGKNSKGETVAFTPFDSTGMFIYNSSIAQEVLGTDDPDEVQKAVGDWRSFIQTAEKMKDAGYYMFEKVGYNSLSAYNSTLSPFIQNASGNLINTDTSEADQTVLNWYNTIYRFEDNNYVKNYSYNSSNCFGCFVPYEHTNYKSSFYYVRSKDNYYDSVCAGPAGYYTAGGYMLVSSSSDNKALAAEIIKRLTCDHDTMKALAMYEYDVVNNKDVMNELTSDTSFTHSDDRLIKMINAAINAANALSVSSVPSEIGWQYEKLAYAVYYVTEYGYSFDIDNIIGYFTRSYNNAGKYNSSMY